MCSYDCSVHPTDINEDNDITGIGVLIGYCATAGIAVFIIVFHYLFSYEPRLDPFREKQANALLCVRPRSNPIDEIVLRGPRELFFKAFGITNSGRKNHARFEKSLVKCILSMSDVQIITGISIIVSGAAQLKCGISTHQWQVLVYLAWFSSLTHLSCLTLLRNCLHQRPAERIWRLVCMFVLVVLLILAFLPTANYRWQYGYSAKSTGHPALQVYAICYLRPVQRPDPARNHMYASVDNGHAFSDSSIMAMSISIVLLFVGFVCRVLKMHQSLSYFFARTIRGSISRMLSKPLRTIEGWCVTPSFLHSLQRLLLYRPLLALFLTLRILVETWNSMFFEVWWLIISFIWGVQRLFSAVRLCANREDIEWSFGQVMSIALLAVPLVTVFEFFYPESKTQKVEERQGQMCSVSVDRSEVISEIPAYSELALPVSQDLARRIFNDHPDYEFYYASCSLVAPAVTLVLSLCVVSLSLWCLIRACTFNDLEGLGFLQISFYPWGLTPLVLPFCIFYGILFSFLIASIRSKKRRKGEGHSLLVRSLPVLVIICLTGAAFVMFAFEVSGPYSGWAAIGVAGLYFLCSLFALAGDWHTRVHLAEV
ncbi:unnamed protein product [Penicillium salamii]|uniref:Uncharacterized protein n=1 Tax=Penicillium salamii TaxID=1612424 RepID=A0A9W4I7C6_9EURO|nr:unnamed protein product [Penicillium salamii]CAG7966817.1 unnamed protein product [Penicillium salamii]CAG7970094.1 unnamed protein product [Penicillium salamii]CAG7995740.1 unnamed protein product [Penicillium salamii]CAG7998107.1 unnamed protein product [Penicillium salamii]